MDLPIRFDDLLLLVVSTVRTHTVADLGVLAVVAKHGVNAGRLVVGATGVSLALRGAFLGIGHDSRLLFKSTALAVQTILRSVIKNSMFRYFCCARLGCNGERIIEQHPEKSMKIWHLHRNCCACLVHIHSLSTSGGVDGGGSTTICERKGGCSSQKERLRTWARSGIHAFLLDSHLVRSAELFVIFSQSYGQMENEDPKELTGEGMVFEHQFFQLSLAQDKES